MIPVFVISLPDCTDRRDRIQGHLNGLGIPFEFVDAVDGRSGLAPEHEREIDRAGARRNGRLMTDAEFACALSHVKVCRRIVQNNIPWALVFEDDAIPMADLLIYLRDRHYEHTDLVQIYHQRTYVRRTGARSLFGPYRAWLRTKYRSPGASAYVISLRGARLIATRAVPIRQVADWPDCVDELIDQMRAEVVSPRLANHTTEGSILSVHGRKANKEKRRFLGMYLPPFRLILRSWARTPLKLIGKPLR